MIVGVIGSGGREHAICELLKRSKKVNKIYCFPGNAGTSKIADNVNIDTNNFEIFKDYILKNKIELVVVGPEKPLVDGLVDYLQKFKNTALVISHDRNLLNKSVTSILHLSQKKLIFYNGNYDFFDNERRVQLEQKISQKINKMPKEPIWKVLLIVLKLKPLRLNRLNQELKF